MCRLDYCMFERWKYFSLNDTENNDINTIIKIVLYCPELGKVGLTDLYSQKNNQHVTVHSFSWFQWYNIFNKHKETEAGDVWKEPGGTGFA